MKRSLSLLLCLTLVIGLLCTGAWAAGQGPANSSDVEIDSGQEIARSIKNVVPVERASVTLDGQETELYPDCFAVELTSAQETGLKETSYSAARFGDFVIDGPVEVVGLTLVNERGNDYAGEYFQTHDDIAIQFVYYKVDTLACILNYHAEAGIWDSVDFSVDYKSDTVTMTLDQMGPVAFILKAVKGSIDVPPVPNGASGGLSVNINGQDIDLSISISESNALTAPQTDALLNAAQEYGGVGDITLLDVMLVDQYGNTGMNGIDYAEEFFAQAGKDAVVEAAFAADGNVGGVLCWNAASGTWDNVPISISSDGGTVYAELSRVGSVAILTLKDEEAVPGDIDDDGEVTIFDLVLIFEFATGQRDTLSNASAADIDNDGEITIFDLVIIFEYATGQR